MARVSTTEGGYGGGASVIHTDSSHSEYVSVPDADLLFRGDYHRAGPDLVLTGHDGRHHIVPGYFASEKHAALVAPNGASLSADVVDLLAGSPAPGQYAQAQPTTPPDSIGKVEKIVGDVTVVRNGVSVALHVGDAVFKSDVIVTGGDSSAGITFPDGTVLDLVANSRMALNEYSFEPNGANNGAVFTLVEGTFGFVAGQVAQDNHMSVVTPVATMGIRGTAGIVRHEFRANAGDLLYSFLVLDEVDIRRHGHHVGAYEVRDNRPDSPTFGEILQLIADSGYVTSVELQGSGLPPIVTTEPITNSRLFSDRPILQDLVDSYGQFNGPGGIHSPGSGDNPILFVPPPLFQNGGQPLNINFSPGGGSNAPTTTVNTTFDTTPPPNPGPTANVFIWGGGTANYPTQNWSQPGVPDAPADIVEILTGTVVFPDGANVTISELIIGPNGTLDIAGGSLTVGKLVDLGTLIVGGDPPTLTITGSLTVGNANPFLVSDGSVDIVDAVVQVNSGGQIEANTASAIIDLEDSQVTNGGTIDAVNGGVVFLNDGTTVNGGTVSSDVASMVEIQSGPDGSGATLKNVTISGTFQIDSTATLALHGNTVIEGAVTLQGSGAVTLGSGDQITGASGGGNTLNNDTTLSGQGQIGTGDLLLTLDNDAAGVIDATGGTLILNTGTTIDNAGLLEATASGILDVKDKEINNSGTGTKGIVIDATSELLVDVASLKLDGTGQVALNGGTITGQAAGNELENFDNTIVGTGTISNVDLDNDAAGVIDATGGTLILNTGTTIDNAGLLEATASGILDVKDKEINNSGTGTKGIVIDATSELLVDVASLKLDGTGQVALNGGTITGQAAGNELENFDNTIVGTGTISNVDLDNDAAGVIDATGGTLILNTGTTIDNAGLLEATASGILDVKDKEINNSGTGTKGIVIDATSELLVDVASLKLDGTGQVALNGGTITGQAAGNELENFDNTIVGTGTISNVDLDNDAAGVIDATGGTLILNTGTTIDNAGLLEATASGILDVKDKEINNSGTGTKGIVIDATSELLVDVASLKLDGTGQVALNGGTITGQAAGNELENFDNTIVGTGTISNVDLDNDAAGVIDATGGTLILNTGTTIDNAGLLEATASGILDVKDKEINNSGTGTKGIVIDATSELLVDVASLKLDGTGQVALNGGTITGQAAGNELENFDNTIVGTGTISNVDLDNDAAGVIDATGGTLILNTGTTIDNAGLLEATASGILDVKDKEINNSGTGTKGIVIDATSELLVDVASLKLDGTGQVALNGGTITGQAAGNELENFDNTIVGTGTISNVDLDNDAAGVIDATGGTLILNTGTTIDNAGLLEATASGILDVKDKEINNSGTGTKGIVIDATSELLVDVASLKLDGTGQVALNGGTITGQAAGNELENFDNTIVGTGTISNVDLDNDAAGVIDATGGTLILNTGTTIDNAGLLEATASGILDVKDKEINNSGTGTKGIVIDATSELLVDVASLKLDGTGQVALNGGTITGQAAGNELENFDNTIVGTGTISNVDLDNDAAGVIDATGGTLILNTGTTIDNAGLLEATASGILDVKDKEINNSGTGTKGIVIDATSELLVDVASLKLDGTGQVALNGGTITGQAAGNELENFDNTIVGTGTISNVDLDNDAAGVIDATGGTLILNTGTTIDNAGLLEATASGTLQIDDPVSGSSTAIGAIIKGGTLIFEAQSNVNTSFDGEIGTLVLYGTNTSKQFTGTVSSLTNGDIFDLAGIAYNTTGTHETRLSTSYNGTFSTLTVSDGSAASSITIKLKGYYDSDDFTLSSDSNGRVKVTLNQDNEQNERPAGVAGSPINLALANPPATTGGPIAVTITGVPSGWQLNEGTNLGNGTWTLETGDPGALTVLTAAAYAGAMVLNVTETWTSADGSTGTATVADNVEAYAPGNPIFALAGADNLTGAGANDLFVFAQPIGDDTIYNFNVATDKIDLIGFAKIASFSDIQANIVEDSNGDAVITIGAGETITLQGVSAASLTAADFVFNQTPVVENAGNMVVSDGAVLPLSGTIDNTGTIALNSTGDQTELQIVGDGVTLEGGGQVTLSGAAVITGTGAAAVLTNVDNTVSGAGQIGSGDGMLTLINETHGTIDANVVGGTLTLETGTTITNNGLLETLNGGTLQIDDPVTGSGSAIIAGGTMIFGAQSNMNVAFENGVGTPTYGELVLGDAAGFSGQISGFAGTAPDTAHSDAIDLEGINYNSSSFSETYDAAKGLLTVTDGNHSASLTFDNFDGTLSFASDGNGGTLITDPPTARSSSPSPSVSVGGPGNDNFVFQPGIGADTIANFNPRVDTIELDHFANIQNVQQLAALIGTDAHGDAVVELGHNDSITLPGVTQSYLQAHLQSLVHLG